MKLLVSLTPLLLMACATTPAAPAPEPTGECRGDALAGFVGQRYTAALGARMLKASGATKLRPVAKGMMVTMDYRADRLTVYLDANGRVERASCG